jgi:hypothetical protein
MQETTYTAVIKIKKDGQPLSPTKVAEIIRGYFNDNVTYPEQKERTTVTVKQGLAVALSTQSLAAPVKS